MVVILVCVVVVVVIDVVVVAVVWHHVHKSQPGTTGLPLKRERHRQLADELGAGSASSHPTLSHRMTWSNGGIPPFIKVQPSLTGPTIGAFKTLAKPSNYGDPSWYPYEIIMGRSYLGLPDKRGPAGPVEASPSVPTVHKLVLKGPNSYRKKVTWESETSTQPRLSASRDLHRVPLAAE
jgi:hypothetical protein